MRKICVVVCLCALVLSSCGPASAPLDFSGEENPLPSELIQAIEQRVEGLMQGPPPVTSMSIAVYKAGHSVYNKAYGYADIEAGTEVTSDTPYYIASTTKMFTAAAILKLADEGELALDDPITKFFPDYAGAASEVQVQHLLTHSSGIMDALIGMKMETEPEKVYTAEDRQAFYQQLFDSVSLSPGSMDSYSDYGYTLLAMIIESVMGLTYAEYLAEAIYEPAAMVNTSQCLIPPADIAQGYNAVGESADSVLPIEMNNLTLENYGAGSLCSTPSDLVRFHHALRSGVILKPETYAQMVEIRTAKPIAHQYLYGYGTFIYEVSDKVVYTGYIGNLPGFLSAMFYYPEKDLTIAVLTNMNSAAGSVYVNAIRLNEIIAEECENTFPVE